MLKNYCHLYILLKNKEKLLRLLWIYDLDNIDLQIELLKTYYELKDVKEKIKAIVCE